MTELRPMSASDPVRTLARAAKSLGLLCKICGSDAPLRGVVDFNKGCQPVQLPLLGVAVWYRRCVACGFLFTGQFDHWSRDEWKRAVYNDDYAIVDPEADEVRPMRNAAFVNDVVHQLGVTRILDYGGGDGMLARWLCEVLMDAQSWDVLHDDPRPTGDFDLITCFEVFEHTPTPRETLDDLLSFLRPAGSVLFSTLTDEDWHVESWYCAPRNGHVSLHTVRSLGALFGSEWSVRSLSAGVHLARRVD